MFEDVLILKKGGIHIKKKNRGKFTAAAKRAGMGTQEYAKHILANKDDYSTVQIKRAAFAKGIGGSQIKRHKHENGGILKYQNPAGLLLESKDTLNTNYLAFKRTLPDNLRLTPEKDYHMYDYWKLNGEPKNFREGKRRGMFTWDRSDKGYHAGSIAEDRNTGIYHFMKPKHHPTVKYELDWFNKGLQTLEGGKQVPVEGKGKEFWEDFTSKYQLDTTGVDYRYVPIKKNGGILKAQNSVKLDNPVSRAFNSYLTQPFKNPEWEKFKEDSRKRVEYQYKNYTQDQLREHNAKVAAGLEREFVEPDGTVRFVINDGPIQPLEQNIAEWLPGTGDAAEVGYIVDDVKNGNLGSAVLGASLMFLPGNFSKLISKSRVDPIFINGKVNQAGIQEGLFGGKRSAESFMGSQTYKDAIAHDRALAKRAFGYDINPVTDDRYIKMPVKVEGESLGPHDAGIMYANPNTNNPADDIIKVDVGKHKTVNDLGATIFHEDLHHGRFKTIDPQGNTMFTEIYHPEKINPTLDFYRWKLKHLFKPEVEIPQELLDHYKYLTSVEIPHNEGATNVLELGFLGNARAKSGYPGAQEVQKILDEVRKANPQHAYTIDLLNMKKPKRVWEAMTGQYEDGGKLTDDDYREGVKKFLSWRTVGPEESTYIKNFKI